MYRTQQNNVELRVHTDIFGMNKGGQRQECPDLGLGLKRREEGKEILPLILEIRWFGTNSSQECYAMCYATHNILAKVGADSTNMQTTPLKYPAS